MYLILQDGVCRWHAASQQRQLLKTMPRNHRCYDMRPITDILCCVDIRVGDISAAMTRENNLTAIIHLVPTVGYDRLIGKKKCRFERLNAFHNRLAIPPHPEGWSFSRGFCEKFSLSSPPAAFPRGMPPCGPPLSCGACPAPVRAAWCNLPDVLELHLASPPWARRGDTRSSTCCGRCHHLDQRDR